MAASSILALAVSNASVSAAGVPKLTLLGDLNPDGSGSYTEGAEITDIVALGHRVVFVADDSEVRGVWASDGTDAGTHLLKAASLGIGLAGQTSRYVYLTLSLSGDRSEVWRTDGTPEGTIELASPTGPVHSALKFAVAAEKLFFAACPPGYCELWVAAGTPATTQRLATIATLDPIQSMVAAGTRIFASGREGGQPFLLVSDGTVAGTRRIGLPEEVVVEQTIGVGERLFFTANTTNGTGQDVWTSDGTAAGTLPVTEFAAPGAHVLHGSLFADGTHLVFAADDVVGGEDIWSSDGTPAGTHRLTDFGFAQALGGTLARRLVRHHGRLLFSPPTASLLYGSGAPAESPVTRRRWPATAYVRPSTPLRSCSPRGMA